MDEGYVFTSPAFFNFVFDKCNFSIISSLFDDNKPNELSMHIVEMVREKMHHICGEVGLLRIKVKKFKTVCQKNVLKTQK